MEALSKGEVHFLRSFIQGSIMLTETRRRLLLAWGMCPRHSLAALSVEAVSENCDRPRFADTPRALCGGTAFSAKWRLYDRPPAGRCEVMESTASAVRG